MIYNLRNIDSFDNKSHTFRIRIEYLLTRGDVQEARKLFDDYYKHGNNNVPKSILEAKLFCAEKKFYESVNLLNSTKEYVLKTKNPQRRTTLPMIADLLIQAASGMPLPNGIVVYQQNQKYLPSSIREQTKNELTQQVAHSKYQLSSGEREALDL